MYKNSLKKPIYHQIDGVSILVLMDLCIKTELREAISSDYQGFNPCFNGSMYKNHSNGGTERRKE